MSYAHLGYTCETNMNVLIDNRKFFPINDPVYDVFYTKMQKYPSTNEDLPAISDEIEKPEDIKTAKQKIRQTEEYSSCCGKK